MKGPVAILLCLFGVSLAVDKSEFCASEACTRDWIAHCMTDGSIVRGCYNLKNAICQQNKEENESWDGSRECVREGYCEELMCTADLIPHCMMDGSIVRGCGDLKNAVCQQGKIEDRNWTGEGPCPSMPLVS